MLLQCRTVSVNLKNTGQVQWSIKHYSPNRPEGLRSKFLWQRLQQDGRPTLHCILSRNQSSVRLQKLRPKHRAIWLADARQTNFLRATQEHSFSLLSSIWNPGSSTARLDCRTRLSNKPRDRDSGVRHPKPELILWSSDPFEHWKHCII